jgi:F-box interacting protein
LAATIPDDLLIHEVLVHLPAKSLARCRCVCRSWRAGIAGAAFVRRHLELSRATPLPSVLVIPREVDADDNQATSTEISFHRLPLPPPGRTATGADLVFEKAWPGGITRIIHPTHCDGLVAIATTTDRVFVCNPATREFVALPPGSHNAEMDARDLLLAPPVALGFDQWRNRYVVARYFYRTYGERSLDEVTDQWSLRDYDIGHEVFTLGGGSGSSWELTEDPPHPVGVAQQPMCTRRAFYWHADEPQPQLLRFGLQHRTFDVVHRPPTAWNTSTFNDMTDLEDGTLCYVHAAAAFQVWMANDAPQLQWSLRCRIDLPDMNSSFLPIVADGDTLVAIVNERLCRCSAQNGSVEEEVADMRYMGRLRDDCDSMRYAVPYFESLVSLTVCNY